MNLIFENEKINPFLGEAGILFVRITIHDSLPSLLPARHNRVFTPQARSAHHPRNASNATNIPPAASPTRPHQGSPVAKNAAASSATAIPPRTIRPPREMFGLK
jgi:hypothetical protein